LLAVLGLAAGIANTSRASWADHGEDMKIDAMGNRPLDAAAERLIETTPGVASVEPMLVTDVNLAGKSARIWALEQATMFRFHISSGRWYTPGEERGLARVAVVERDIARVTGTRPGDSITVETASGPITFHVIGIATNQQEGGTAMFVPLTTMHALMTGLPAGANDYWVRTTSPRHALIDSTTTRLEDTLAAHGYQVTTEIKYVRLASEVAGYRTLTTTLAVVGLLVVGISMAGLAGALTASVLERTREIGILRSLGARARHIRQIFATETLAPGRGRLAHRRPPGLPPRPLPRLARQGGGQRRRAAHVPAPLPRAGAGGYRGAGTPDHPDPDQTGRAVPTRRCPAVHLKGIREGHVESDGRSALADAADIDSQ
jgi:putative ABC transport system permease protein